MSVIINNESYGLAWYEGCSLCGGPVPDMMCMCDACGEEISPATTREEKALELVALIAGLQLEEESEAGAWDAGDAFSTLEDLIASARKVMEVKA